MIGTLSTTWRGQPSHQLANDVSSDSLISHLGIEFLPITGDELRARMPVDHRTRQPLGYLHGGATVALAETLASWAATLTIDPEQTVCLGVETHASHHRSVTEGWVTGGARRLSSSRHAQVWEVGITDDTEQLVCVSRCTIRLTPRRSACGADD